MRIRTTRASARRVYVCHRDTAPILRKRLGDVTMETATYGQVLSRNGSSFRFIRRDTYSARRRFGSPWTGEIWVASGDYKLESDGVSPAFEPLRCHAFITESTFGLPIYRWRPQGDPFAAIDAWRRENIAAGAREHSVRLCARQGAAADRPSRPVARADRLSRRGRSDQCALSRRGNRSAAHASRDGNQEQARVLQRRHCRAAVGRREPLAQALRRLFRCARERLDAGAGQPPPARARPRLCAVRPRRLARPDRRHRGDGCGTHPRDAWVFGNTDAISPREGSRRACAHDVLR